MALNSSQLKRMIEVNLISLGFAANEHGRMNDLAEAIAKAVVEHITASGQVIVIGGGHYSGEIAKIV
ncbi:hypothetical protein Xvie_03957 [Xenorhabdus vietnamensis]|uniref:Uncharacterized protein n=2 Tax=Xenorhabdus vietnamensis TaxID=351656 RepID=A0A1Y2S8D6_9GAMM|nr:hypothetical protein [Xenorhabdus vietnamensis]OTA14152.1 hypothetical protein Xvie_03957 [Xenorhabdus vietnamensis]